MRGDEDTEAADEHGEGHGGRRFHWSELDTLIDELAPGAPLLLCEDGAVLSAGTFRIELPLAIRPHSTGPDALARLRASLDSPLPLQLVVLAQAGAVSLGLFDEGLALETRTLKKYTVRGRGKAQPTHLKRRGKSRYGSRLRLQNAENLVRETHEKLRAWMDVYGRPEGLFHAAPVRLWADFFQPRFDPALAADAGWIRIRRNLPVPTTALLLRVYDGMAHGRVLPADAADPSLQRGRAEGGRSSIT